MPELPEVEVVRRGLDDHVVGRMIDAATVHDARSVRRHVPGPEDFAARLAGRTVVAARRRGKYLWLPTDDGDAIVAHLGMSGQMLVSDPGSPPQKHLKVTLELGDGRQLRFVDQRIFGGLAVSDGGAELPAEIAHIARDPMDPLFDADEFAARLKRRETGIKRALLDQSLVSGVGNIYADEALWRVPLHYARNTRTLRRALVDDLLAHVTEVMSEALAQGGTSFDALYVNVNGASGYFDRSLNAYGREGEGCVRCGAPMRRSAFMNRSSFWCPTCQPRPRNGRF
ncbi:MAG: bifunctional DNA-formamidopyrimidine glycosylase/DNA-(apurinic or apyrimidinic site) lyase [Aeromicrobium sp.]|uniref:bifunctional DNA-formamidopyrimidine glycosylase/DNA-(apurinic or apyrimidinic site) lyase n=1 Tax=Aeromicrobium sp. TaxID=1871063 RepID=UPI0039E652E5